MLIQLLDRLLAAPSRPAPAWWTASPRRSLTAGWVVAALARPLLEMAPHPWTPDRRYPGRAVPASWPPGGPSQTWTGRRPKFGDRRWAGSAAESDAAALGSPDLDNRHRLQSNNGYLSSIEWEQHLAIKPLPSTPAA